MQSDIFPFLYRAAASPDGDSANSFLHRFLLHLPAVCPVFLPETDMIGSTAYFLWKTVFLCGQFQCIFQMPDAFCNHRPSIFPCDFRQKSLSSHAAVSFTRSGCQHYHVPVPLTILHQISVSCVDHRIVFPRFLWVKIGFLGQPSNHWNSFYFLQC